MGMAASMPASAVADMPSTAGTAASEKGRNENVQAYSQPSSQVVTGRLRCLMVTLATVSTTKVTPLPE